MEINGHFTCVSSWTYIYIFHLMSSSIVNRQAKDVIKAIKKRLGSKSPNTQLYAVQVGSWSRSIFYRMENVMTFEHFGNWSCYFLFPCSCWRC